MLADVTVFLPQDLAFPDEAPALEVVRDDIVARNAVRKQRLHIHHPAPAELQHLDAFVKHAEANRRIGKEDSLMFRNVSYTHCPTQATASYLIHYLPNAIKFLALL